MQACDDMLVSHQHPYPNTALAFVLCTELVPQARCWATAYGDLRPLGFPVLHGGDSQSVLGVVQALATHVKGSFLIYDKSQHNFILNILF